MPKKEKRSMNPWGTTPDRKNKHVGMPLRPVSLTECPSNYKRLTSHPMQARVINHF